MRKRILGSLPIAIALMSIPFVAKGEGPGYMVVVDKEGQQYETAIPDVAKVDFDTFSFTVQTKSGDRTTYDYETTARINLAASSGISLQDKDVNLAVWPIPATTTLNVRGAATGSIIRIYDMSGAERMTCATRDGITSLDVSGLTAGQYILHTGNTSVKFIKK